jgi:hypothetical protein
MSDTKSPASDNYHLRRAIEAAIKPTTEVTCTYAWKSNSSGKRQVTLVELEDAEANNLLEHLQDSSPQVRNKEWEEEKEEWESQLQDVRDDAQLEIDDLNSNISDLDGKIDDLEAQLETEFDRGKRELLEELLIARRQSQLDDCLKDAATFYGVTSA